MREISPMKLLLAALGLSVLVAACGDDKPAAKPPAKPAAPAAAPAAAAPAEAAGADGGATPATADADGGVSDGGNVMVAEYVYTPIGKRDPFRSFFEDMAAQAAQNPEINVRCGPLCRWELDQLRLVAVVSGTASPLAMVEDPDGRGHLVRRGSFIGKRSGKVSDIRRDQVVVTELIRRNSDGALIPAKSELALRPNKKQTKNDEIVDLSAPQGQ